MNKTNKNNINIVNPNHTSSEAFSHRIQYPASKITYNIFLNAGYQLGKPPITPTQKSQTIKLHKFYSKRYQKQLLQPRLEKLKNEQIFQ